MKSLILPCAGRSTRFPGMRPKWLLTHPDGKLMIEKSIEKLDLGMFDRIVIPILRQHDEDYQAKLILNQVFRGRVEVLVLPHPTNGPAETVGVTLRVAGIKDSFVIKDCDNSVTFDWGEEHNFVVSLDVQGHTAIRNLPAKSYLTNNEQGYIIDIVEKRIASNIICLGVYGFQDPSLFLSALPALRNSESEIYVSHVIAYLIGTNQSAFQSIQAKTFEDWGTFEDWRETQQKHATYICDLDGVIFKNTGQYGKRNWSDPPILLTENINALLAKIRNGAQVIFMSARSEEFREPLTEALQDIGFREFQLILGCHHAPRILINDFAPTNPYPSAVAINLPRDGALTNYL